MSKLMKRCSTELTLLIGKKDTKIPLFDTTKLHAKAAVNKAFDFEL